MKKVHQMDPSSFFDINSLISEMEKSGVFGAGRIAQAYSILSEMFEDDDSTVFLGLAGAMVPGGMGKIISELIKQGYVDVLVTTGANITHDLIEAFGYSHNRDVVDNDTKLYKEGINRIYDSYLKNEAFEGFEKKINEILDKIFKNKSKISANKLLNEIGMHLEDESSIVRQAYLNEVPIFVPALTDSVLGLQIYLYLQGRDIDIGFFRDLNDIIDISHNCKKAGAIILGGGVPKNYIFQSILMCPKCFDYAIQITTDRPENGGLSGATLEEAVSWGKVNSEAKTATIYCDSTIAFPLLISNFLEKK